MNIAALAVSLLALIASATAVLYTRRQAIAAERALALEEQAAARYRAPWVLSHVKGDTYALTNDGDEPVVDVEITPPPNSAVRGGLNHDRIGPGSSESFLVAPSMSSPHRDVVITWRRAAGGAVHEWKAPLPAKP